MLIMAAVIIGLLACFGIAVIVADVNRFVIREYCFDAPGLRKDYTLVMLSDLHNKSFGRHNDRLYSAIERLSPDSVMIAGDMITAEEKADMEPALGLVTRLARRWPVYYGNGNHETKLKLQPDVFGDIYAGYEKELKKTGARHLVNESILLPETGIRVYGLELGKKYFRKFKMAEMPPSYLDQLLGKPSGEYRILIAHNPDYFKTYAAWGADLVLSGHVHGGIVRLPGLGGMLSPSLHLFPKYDGGVFAEGKSNMVLGRGLGTHTIPVRVFNPGELIVVRLKCGSKRH